MNIKTLEIINSENTQDIMSQMNESQFIIIVFKFLIKFYNLIIYKID